jgi:hypothetical protein
MRSGWPKSPDAPAGVLDRPKMAAETTRDHVSRFKRGVRRTPEALLFVRLLCAPGIIWAERTGRSGIFLASIVGIAFVSDVFDGIVARRIGSATPQLRRADTIIDTAFYLSAAIALFRRAPSVIEGEGPGLALLAALEIARFLLERIKFGRLASYHLWSAKAWGIALFLGFSQAFVRRAPAPLFRIAVLAGILSDLEGLLASLILSDWHCDVPSVFHAARLEKLKAEKRSSRDW